MRNTIVSYEATIYSLPKFTSYTSTNYIPTSEILTWNDLLPTKFHFNSQAMTITSYIIHLVHINMVSMVSNNLHAMY